MKPRIRILPIIIFTATLALTLKVGGIWQGNEVSVSTATAAETPPKPEAPHGEDKSSESHSKPGKAGGDQKGDGGEHSSKTKSVGDAFDPTSVTQAEFQVLQRLSDRRAELDKMRRDLALRENLLAATEKKLNAKLMELNGLKAKIEDLLKKHDEEQDAKLNSLVKIYETMKPKNAARIFEQLEMDILLDVVERMREAKTSLIFAAMDPSKAKAITSRLAERREIPHPSVVTDGS
jgi:flagellar motility protein MotE (MotC chaperone)